MLSGLGRSYKVGRLLFVGGEPTLYTDDINSVLSGFPSNDRPHVTITTNGYFASTKAKAALFLKRFRYLDAVQLSYDRYHKKFLPINNVAFLYRAAKYLGKEFSVILTIENPMDLTLVEEFRGAGDFPVGVQKVHPTPTLPGDRLRRIYPGFDPAVFKKKCPNLGKMAYLCGEGFSVCCSYLTRGQYSEKFIHPGVNSHRKSRFYRLISRYSLGQIMERSGVSAEKMLPEFSSPCVLCNYIFSKALSKNPEIV